MSVAHTPVVLVTGGGGRLGRLVVSALRNRGRRVLSLSRKPVSEHPDDLIVDLNNPDDLPRVVRDAAVDTVIHLAAVVHGGDVVSANGRMDDWLRSLIRTVEPSAIVFASSSAVYGDRQRNALTEDSPMLGESPYAVAKRETESALRCECERRPGLSVTTLRIFNIAGPDFPDSLVQRLIAADSEQPVTLLPIDSFVRDYIHQADVVRSILAAQDRPQRGFRILNVGAGKPVSTRLLLESLRVPEENWIAIEGRTSSSWADNSAAVEWLGVKPDAVPTAAWASSDPAIG